MSCCQTTKRRPMLRFDRGFQSAYAARECDLLAMACMFLTTKLGRHQVYLPKPRKTDKKTRNVVETKCLVTMNPLQGNGASCKCQRKSAAPTRQEFLVEHSLRECGFNV